jgi:hypothetical protein
MPRNAPCRPSYISERGIRARGLDFSCMQVGMRRRMHAPMKASSSTQKRCSILIQTCRIGAISAASTQRACLPPDDAESVRTRVLERQLGYIFYLNFRVCLCVSRLRNCYFSVTQKSATVV